MPVAPLGADVPIRASSAWRESILLRKLLATDAARPMTINGQADFAFAKLFWSIAGEKKGRSTE